MILKVGNNMQAGSLCGHGQLGFNPISSALKYFEQEIMSAVYNNSKPLEKMYTPTRTRPGELE